MLCQHCSKNTANTHIKTIVNGEFREYMLCSECAKKLGYMSPIDSFESGLDNFFGSFFRSSENEIMAEPERCDKCGTSFAEITKTGKIGCANCYSKFYERMKPSIQRIHGNTRHVGKTPLIDGSKICIIEKINKAKKELQLAINKQEFEKAAKIRDEIKELEKEDKEND